MKRTTTIFFALLFFASLHAQTGFKTVVPQEPIVSGEPFQVQYVMENGDKQINVQPPIFSNFRSVTGPYIYMGSVTTVNGIRPVKNTVYTLKAGRPGKFVIPGASITINGRSIRSNDAFVEVISKDEALKRSDEQNSSPGSDYFLRPGENVYEKINQNLFVKVMVDKKSCYVGEPVLATFKLYSRLESKSDIVKNPGFYGFTIFDMVNLADKQVATENIDGKIFDVHTIRKVQLYPLRSGSFTIDAMEVKNKVEFSRSAVLKKTEQEITEGVLGGNDAETATPEEGKEVFETDIHTEPVVITVKPIPEKNKPETFSGATGRFSINAALTTERLAKNEQGFLEITIKGKGNFIQLSTPTIQWPSGIESFEPTVKDELDKTVIPLAGSRTFRYPFVCSAGGVYQFPSVTISYFDIDSNSYKTITTDKIKLTVSNEEKQNNLAVEEKKVSITEKNERASLIAVAIVIALVLIVLVYWLKAKKEPEVIVKQEQVFITPAEILQPAWELTEKTPEGFQTLQELAKTAKEFYSAVHTSIWNYLDIRFGFHSSDMNKAMLAARLQDKDVSKELTDRLNQIISHCETGMYTNASLDDDKVSFIEETKLLLEGIDRVALG